MTDLQSEQLRPAAVQLARDGYTVIPCKPSDKRPKAVDRWKETASYDPTTIDEVWSEAPWNIGIVCMPSGIFVLDVDGPQGEVEMAKLEDTFGRLPVTTEVRTPGRGGGRHLYFAAPEGMQLLPKLDEHIDCKHNGYVLAPPSLHPDGGIYRWERKMRPADPPAWLIDRLERKVADDMPEREKPARNIEGRWENAEDWFDVTFTCQDVMAHVLEGQRQRDVADGWKYISLQNGNYTYTRPGKAIRAGISLVIYKFSHTPGRPCPRHEPRNCQYCLHTRAQMFSTSDPELHAGSYGPWRLFEHLVFSDDRVQAREFLIKRGFMGKTWAQPTRQQEKELGAMIAPRSGKSRLITRLASTMQPIIKQWVFPGLVPKGELTLVTGMSGSGKSLMCIDLISRITRGVAHPSGTGCFTEPQNVLLLTGEEDDYSVVIPRLMAAEADISRVHLQPRIADPTTGEVKGWHLGYIEYLEELILSEKVTFIVCDVLKQIMRHRNDSDELEVRRELQPIVDLCHRTGVTFIGVRHTVKNPTSASSAGAGSLAYNALCRSELLITKETDHDGTPIKVCTVNKSSYGVDGKRMEYGLELVPVEARHETGEDGLTIQPRVVWSGTWALSVDPDTMLETKAERTIERVLHEAVKRTLKGAEAIGFTLDSANFRRILTEHLDEMDWEGGRSENTLRYWEKKCATQGLIIRKIERRGPPLGTLSTITLAEAFRAG